MSLVSIVIVNYRSGEILKSCLGSLVQSLSSLDFEILIINNDSTRDLAPVLAQDWPNTRIIQNSSNLGFGAAANIGFLQSSGKFLLLLNPDILAQENSIHVLLQTLDSSPEAGIALPQLRNPDGSLQYSCRRFYTYITLLLRRGPLRRLCSGHSSIRDHLMLDWNHESLACVDWGLGAAMLVRRSAIEDPPLFDEGFFLYFEDVDLCFRMRQRGWKVLYNPAAIMIHQHRRESARPGSFLARRHHFSSLMKFLWKYRFRLNELQ